jgi:hypothetical protein
MKHVVASLLKQLNIDAMQQKGFKLTADDIYRCKQGLH